MKHLIGINCSRCQKKFFILNQQLASTQPFCSSCLKLEGVNEGLKESLQEVLTLYKDGPSTGRYRIEEINDDEDKEER